jgi:glutamate--cysteine ligase
VSSPSKIDSHIITGKRELVEWFEKACVPASRQLIGVEHEKPPFYLTDFAPVTYTGGGNRNGIAHFMQEMIAHHGWSPGVVENGTLIDIHKNGMVSWTFEPGMQMETGGAPLRNVHQNAAETESVIKEAVTVADKLGFGMLAQGYHPTHRGIDLPMMPKSRYAMLREFINANGFAHGIDLLSCTSTVQVNMGYQSEADMVKMLRVSLALQPIAVALFANSPFREGKLSGLQSTRSNILINNFNGRYGFMLPIAFDPGFGFEMFVDYAMKSMPMMGVYVDNVFIDAKGAKFEQFMDGNLPFLPGQKATMNDWQNHLNTIWPEVRVRRFLEMRGTDNGPAEMIKALPAFWAGLLYDKTALDQAYDMVKDWTNQDRDYLRMMVPQHGLQTPFMGTTVQDLAKNCLAIAESGLKRRNILNAEGKDESVYLEPLHEIASSGRNWAQRLEERYKGIWNGDIRQVFNDMNYANQPSVLKPESKLIVPPPKRIQIPGVDF